MVTRHMPRPAVPQSELIKGYKQAELGTRLKTAFAAESFDDIDNTHDDTVWGCRQLHPRQIEVLLVPSMRSTSHGTLDIQLIGFTSCHSQATANISDDLLLMLNPMSKKKLLNPLEAVCNEAVCSSPSVEAPGTLPSQHDSLVMWEG